MALKSLLITAAVSVAGLGLTLQSAHALPIGTLMNDHPNFLIEDDSAEGIGIDNIDPADPNNDDPNELGVGDTIRGIAEFPFLVDETTLDTFALNGTENNHLSAVFTQEVLAVTPGSVAGTFNFLFGPNEQFATDLGLPEGTMIAFYEDTVDDVTLGGAGCTTTGNGGDCENNVTNGDLVLALGIDDDLDAIWAAFNSPLDPTAAENFGPAEALGQFNFQLEVLFSALGDFVPQPTNPLIDDLATGDNLIEWIGSGSILGSQGVNTPYVVTNDSDLDAELELPVSAPTSVSLLAIGLLGLSFARVRVARKAH